MNTPTPESSALGRRALLGAAGAGLVLPAVARRARAADPVQLTIWAWVPHMQMEIDLFEAANPGIKVNLVVAGQGGPHYVKLQNAIKAGAGAPDVAQIEFDMLPTFRQIKALADLAPYGANEHAGDFIDWSWQQVSDGNQVFAMPWDSGPLGLVYREDILEQVGAKPAETWDEFADQAMKLHKDHPDQYLTNATFSEGAWSMAVLWQAGWDPFHVDGDTIGISINDAAAKKLAAYWQKLLDAQAVDARPGFVTEWYSSFDRGRYAVWIVGAWGPVFLSQFAKSSAGKWRAAGIPQWQAGQNVSANWGGSTLAMMTQTKHPKEAALLATWLMTNQSSALMFANEQFLFPVKKSVLGSPDFLNREYPFYGGQKVNQVFAAAEKQVDAAHFQWSPFNDYVKAQFGTELGAAANGKGTLVEAFDRLQRKVVTYAKQQGFTVKT